MDNCFARSQEHSTIPHSTVVGTAVPEIRVHATRGAWLEDDGVLLFALAAFAPPTARAHGLRHRRRLHRVPAEFKTFTHRPSTYANDHADDRADLGECMDPAERAGPGC